MPLMKQEIYTLEDIFALPEGERAELLEGELYMMAPPSTGHQRLVHFFDKKIGNYIEAHHGKCEVFPAPFGVFLKDEKGNDAYVEPDISVVCAPEKLDNKGCHGAPDWVIEIVSPSSKRMDYLRKMNLYLMAGVREYWIVDPIRESVIVYRQDDDGVPVLHKFGEKIQVGIYEELDIVVE